MAPINIFNSTDDTITQKFHDFVSKIDQLFINLKDDNIIAEKEFTCCVACGHDEMRKNIDNTIVGYVFYPIAEYKMAEMNLRNNDNVKLKITCGCNNKESSKKMIMVIEDKCKKTGIKFEWDKIKNNDMQIILKS